MEIDNKAVKKWYRRAWEHLTCRQQVSAVGWGTRGLIVLTLMLVMVSKMAVNAPEPSRFIWFAVGLAILVYPIFVRKMRWRIRPYGGLSATALFDSRRSRRRWRWFLISNLAILAVYAAVVFRSWYAVLFNDLFYWVDWQLVAKPMLGIMVVAGVLLVLWMVWAGVQRIKATFGRREPYEQAIGNWQQAFEEKRRAYAQLCNAQQASGVVIATAIALLRAITKHRGDAYIGQAKRVLQEALAILVSNDDTRDAMLERARRAVEEQRAREAQARSSLPAGT